MAPRTPLGKHNAESHAGECRQEMLVVQEIESSHGVPLVSTGVLYLGPGNHLLFLVGQARVLDCQ